MKFSTTLSGILFILLLSGTSVYAQTNGERILLAKQYENAGEMEKALAMYKDLFEENATSNTYYKYYYTALLNNQDYKELEKLVNKQIRHNPQQLTYYIDLAVSYKRQEKDADAIQQYEIALEQLGTDRSQVIQLANAFLGIEETAYAIRAYEKGRKGSKSYSFNLELANLYYRTGDYRKSINLYIDFLEEEPNRFNSITNGIQRMLDSDEGHMLLQELIYSRIQQKEDPMLIELLVWDFVLQKDFGAAFIQMKALDKRLKENGKRVLELAETALVEMDWNAAISCYEYVINLGTSSPYYYSARNGLLNSRQRKIYETNIYTENDLLSLKADYLAFLNDYNRADYRAAFVTSELARLEAFYLYDVAAAIQRLEPVVDWLRLQPAQTAELKLVLGDLYLISGDVWEATLIYSQVDKAMKDEPLGEDARYRNARLAYFRGDFLLAQGQLDVLKASTSELVANDALKLSVFITENLGLDSITLPMEMYADAELLFFQNRNAEAMLRLEQLEKDYPAHQLLDDNYYLRFKIAMKEQKPESAVTYLEYIRQEQAYGLLADDAIFNLGELYEDQLDKPEAALQCYEQLILNYKDSIYVSEARKRYRRLRGDTIN